ncbi:MAG: folate family ECF transporter S component [Erysipelotrichaceae bacterium]|nr:folate family ECF transporter S component [Erysipelotrichaceae bacterium]
MNKTKRLTTTAMLIALYVVLSILTPIKLQNFKFTFEALPILIGALLGGPVDGLLVGGVGSFLYQLLFSGYGLTVTTPLWILPHAASGLLVGLYAKKTRYNYSMTSVVIIAILSALLVTALNTLALYVDSKVFGYYTRQLVFAAIPLKILTGVILAGLFSLILPQLLRTIRKM